MAWRKKAGGEVLDLRTGMHLVPVEEPSSGAEFMIQVNTGHDECPHCGHVMPKTNLGEIDAPVHIQAEIDALNVSHTNQRAYAQRHGVRVREVAQAKVPPAVRSGAKAE